MSKGPILFELEKSPPAQADVNTAPPPPDPAPTPPLQGQAMQSAARMMAYEPSFLGRMFWSVGLALLGAVLSVRAWDFVMSLLSRWPLLGYFFTALLAVFIVLLAIMALRELAALSRLSRIDGLRHGAAEALEANDPRKAQDTGRGILALYKNREDTRWGQERYVSLAADQLDACGVLSVLEKEMMAPLDTQAMREVEAAARQVATVTALVPLALADVMTALSANLRMIRRIACIYGGRSGALGNWRLTRAVITHLVATGAVAVGDDLLEPVLGGSILGKLSRRFGEGLVNGALTARVGVAAIEVCRPLPFRAVPRPTAAQLVRNALGGLFKK